jgi:hypothetical protein
MNQNNYEKWVKKKLARNIPAESEDVIDNALYHSVKINSIPISRYTKSKMQQWLQKKHNIPFTNKKRLCEKIFHIMGKDD